MELLALASRQLQLIYVSSFTLLTSFGYILPSASAVGDVGRTRSGALEYISRTGGKRTRTTRITRK